MDWRRRFLEEKKKEEKKRKKKRSGRRSAEHNQGPRVSPDAASISRAAARLAAGQSGPTPPRVQLPEAAGVELETAAPRAVWLCSSVLHLQHTQGDPAAGERRPGRCLYNRVGLHAENLPLEREEKQQKKGERFRRPCKTARRPSTPFYKQTNNQINERTKAP